MLFFIFISLGVVCGFNVEQEKVIYLDPGHGGKDGGAVVNGVKESDLNLEIAFILKEIYEKNGYKVLLPRAADYDLSTDDKRRKKTDLDNRIKLINESKCLFLHYHGY